MEQVDFMGEVMSGVNEGIGEYIIPIKIGSPPIAQHVIMDTRSDLIWVQCEKCQQCHSQFDPIFDLTRSSSYIEIPCESLACDRLIGKLDCDHASSCSYQASYGGGSESKGILVFETIVFGDARMLNMAIGCGHTNKGTFGLGVRGIRLPIFKDIFHLTESGDGVKAKQVVPISSMATRKFLGGITSDTSPIITPEMERH
nr:protein ASPARTIC PROTEASE IN GUARD CELL 2-like [Quercus suber]